jgi:hypothetical protein
VRTAEVVLSELESIGYQIRTDGVDVILRAEVSPPPDKAKALFEELRRCKPEAVRILQNKAEPWPPETQSLIDWFRTATRQEAPFYLNGCTKVVDADKFYEALERDIKAGSAGARARYGVLADDIKNLKKLH